MNNMKSEFKSKLKQYKLNIKKFCKANGFKYGSFRVAIAQPKDTPKQVEYKSAIARFMVEGEFWKIDSMSDELTLQNIQDLFHDNASLILEDTGGKQEYAYLIAYPDAKGTIDFIQHIFEHMGSRIIGNPKIAINETTRQRVVLIIVRFEHRTELSKCFDAYNSGEII